MNFKTKLLAVTVLPVVLLSIASLAVIEMESRHLAERQISEMERRTVEARKTELVKMSKLALSAVEGIRADQSLSPDEARRQAKDLLRSMDFGEDGYFYVYSDDGTNLVHPRLPDLIGRNWWDLKDPNGNHVIRNLIAVAKGGGGFHHYVWNKPSTGELAPKIGYAFYLDDWNWMIGTGLYVDDVSAEVAALTTTLQTSIASTKRILIGLSVGGVLLAALSILAIRLSEQRFADQRLKELTNRIVDVQEEERKRVATELHDGLSQLLVSARYGLDRALGQPDAPRPHSASLQKVATALQEAISEVRRISMALRPSILDDIGLAAALNALCDDFRSQTGLTVEVETLPVADLISTNARTALYRVTQEALTNVVKHAEAERVTVRLFCTGRAVKLQIVDDGKLRLGSKAEARLTGKPLHQGMGFRNMRERVESFGGALAISGVPGGGLSLDATIPFESQADPARTRKDRRPLQGLRALGTRLVTGAG